MVRSAEVEGVGRRLAVGRRLEAENGLGEARRIGGRVGQ